jgi:hypothetical protein
MAETSNQILTAICKEVRMHYFSRMGVVALSYISCEVSIIRPDEVGKPKKDTTGFNGIHAGERSIRYVCGVCQLPHDSVPDRQQSPHLAMRESFSSQGK